MSKSSTVISVRVPNDLLDKMPKNNRSAWIVSMIRNDLGLPDRPDLEARVSALEARFSELSKPEVNTSNTKENEFSTVIHGKGTTLEQREQLIRECYSNGLNYKQTSEWLNGNGYRAQRGPFTPNSVRAMAKRFGI